MEEEMQEIKKAQRESNITKPVIRMGVGDNSRNKRNRKNYQAKSEPHG